MLNTDDDASAHLAEIDAMTEAEFAAEWAEIVAEMGENAIEVEIECARQAEMDRALRAILAGSSPTLQAVLADLDA